MEHRLSATELARNVGEVLAKVRYLGDSFLIERNGEAVARIAPLPEAPHATVREAVASWRRSGESDSGFADDLERVQELDLPPESPWGS